MPCTARKDAVSFVRVEANASNETATPSAATAIPPGGKKNQQAAAKTLNMIDAKSADSAVCPHTPSPIVSGLGKPTATVKFAEAANGESVP